MPVGHRRIAEVLTPGSQCGTTVPKTLGVRRHRCPHRGLDRDRDHNAATKILRRAWPAHGWSLTDLRSPVATARLGARRASKPSGAVARLVA